jgi:hypothetical protein
VTILGIPLEILKIKDPDGEIRHSEQSQRLIQIQNQYTEMVSRWQEMFKELRSSRKLMSESHLQWKLADEIYSFDKKIEKDGYTFANVYEALSRDLGVSRSRLNYLMKFRTHYPSLTRVSKKINWSKYQEILDIKNSKVREICERKILSGEIRTDDQIRSLKKKYREGKVVE